MKIKLYQIAPEKDDKNLMFMGFEFTVLHGGINADSYEIVFDGDLPAQTAEDVFRIFNLEHPNGYRGRSMSVSDIVWMEGIGYWFCDSIGFRQIKFAGEKCSWRKFDGCAVSKSRQTESEGAGTVSVHRLWRMLQACTYAGSGRNAGCVSHCKAFAAARRRYRMHG